MTRIVVRLVVAMLWQALLVFAVYRLTDGAPWYYYGFAALAFAGANVSAFLAGINAGIFGVLGASERIRKAKQIL